MTWEIGSSWTQVQPWLPCRTKDIKVISTQSGYMVWLIRKAIKLVPYKQHEQGGWHWVTYKTWLLCHALSMGHVFRRFHTHPIHVLSAGLSLTVSRLLTSQSRMFGSQVTDTHTLPDPTFFKLYECNKVTTDLDTFCGGFFFLGGGVTSFSWNCSFS